MTPDFAAYKAADITSRLTEAGATVYPVLTESACRFIQPLTLQVLSRNPASSGLWKEGEGWQPGHIELADQALSPAQTVRGSARSPEPLITDLLSSIHLATAAPVMLAPAMNGKMLAHAATQVNLEILRSRGYHFIEPQSGMLACGYEGEGKLAVVEDIMQSVHDFFAQH